jgi:hypothetical protein
MASIPSETTLTNNTLYRPSRFSGLAETSFKSPLDKSYGNLSKSSNDDGSRRRRMSHSPVSVNTNYELSEKNT